MINKEILNTDVLNLIQLKYHKFSKGQKLIANYIVDNHSVAAFLTASKLGDRVGVSESTVVRFAIELGFSGYPKFQKSLQELIKNKLTISQRMDLSNNYLSTENTVKNILKSEIDSLKATMEKFDNDVFTKAVDSIMKSKRVYVIGLRSSLALSSFLGYYLNFLLEDVKVICSNSANPIEEMVNISNDAIVIGIAFPRYASKTIEALSYAKYNEAKTIAITDSNSSPLAVYADFTLTAESNMMSFVDSLVSPLGIITSLIASIGLREKEKVKDTFDKLEDIWKLEKVYSYKN